MILNFIGTRTRDFTIDSPTGIADADAPNGVKQYYVEPGKPLEVADADGKALVKNEPMLWAVAKAVKVTPEG